MPQICSLSLLLVLFALPGCGGSNTAESTPQKSEIETYLAENPEAANAEMAVLDEE